MNTVQIIMKKREGGTLTRIEIDFLVSYYTKNYIPDYQFSAFLMAAYLKGMTREETTYLTEAMLYSGKVLDLSSIPGVKIDKHSTGGVSDSASLILAPAAAAAGVLVPMISGRGLGHTGGTLDKLESIPNFRTNLNLTEYKRVLSKCGAVLIGQTKQIAPADKKIYALRDVTATVESIPLISSSIMSKKLAEGIDGIVLDVKTGSGAFMTEYKNSVKLAKSLLDTAKSFNKKGLAFITDMNQPLGTHIGNWLEIKEVIEVLKGERKGLLLQLSAELTGAMIFLAGKSATLKQGTSLAYEIIESGKAFNKFIEIVTLQGGDAGFIHNPEKYPKAKFISSITAKESGYLQSVDCYKLGMAALTLGAGRKVIDDVIDPKAGIIFNYKIGDYISKGTSIAELHSSKQKKIDDVEADFNGIIALSDTPVEPPELIKKIIK